MLRRSFISFALIASLLLPLSAVCALEELTDSEADTIIQAQEQAKIARKAERIAELEKVTVKSEGRSTLPNGQEVIIREVEPPPNVGPRLVTHTESQPSAAPILSLTPEQITSLQAQAAKENVVLMLSATIYDQSVSRLSWRYEGSEFVAFSNIDFNLLAGAHSIQTDTHDFSFFMGIGDASTKDNPYANETVPHASNFSAARSEYTVMQGDPEHQAAFAGIEALLEHYDANLPELKIEHQRRQALTAARKRYDAKHPKETPEPFIMQFWIPEKRSGVDSSPPSKPSLNSASN